MSKDRLVKMYSLMDFKVQAELYEELIKMLNLNAIGVDATYNLEDSEISLMINEIMLGSIMIGKLNEEFETESKDNIKKLLENSLKKIKSYNELILGPNIDPSNKINKLRNSFEHCDYEIMVDPSKIIGSRVKGYGNVVPKFKDKEEFLYIRLTGDDLKGDIPFSDFLKFVNAYAFLKKYKDGFFSNLFKSNLTKAEAYLRDVDDIFAIDGGMEQFIYGEKQEEQKPSFRKIASQSIVEKRIVEQKQIELLISGIYGNIDRLHEYNLRLYGSSKKKKETSLSNSVQVGKLESIALYIDAVLSYSMFALIYMNEQFRNFSGAKIIPKDIDLAGVKLDPSICPNGMDDFSKSSIDYEKRVIVSSILKQYLEHLNQYINHKNTDKKTFKEPLNEIGQLFDKMPIDIKNGKYKYEIDADEFEYIISRVIEKEANSKTNLKASNDKLDSEIESKVLEIFKEIGVEAEDLSGDKKSMVDSFVSQMEQKYEMFSKEKIIRNLAIEVVIDKAFGNKNLKPDSEDLIIEYNKNPEYKETFKTNDLTKLAKLVFYKGAEDESIVDWIKVRVFSPNTGKDKIDALNLTEEQKRTKAKEIIKKLLSIKVNNNQNLEEYVNKVKTDMLGETKIKEIDDIVQRINSAFGESDEKENKSFLNDIRIAKNILAEMFRNSKNPTNPTNVMKSYEIVKVLPDIQKLEANDASELFRHIRNSFAHGRFKINLKDVGDGYSLIKLNNIIFVFEDEYDENGSPEDVVENSKSKTNFRASITAGKLIEMYEEYISGVDEQIRIREKNGQHVIATDQRRDEVEKKLIKDFCLHPLNNSNSGLIMYLIRHNPEDFESVASEEDLIRALKTSKFNDLLLSEYIPDNENQDRE